MGSSGRTVVRHQINAIHYVPVLNLRLTPTPLFSCDAVIAVVEFHDFKAIDPAGR